MKYDLLGPVPTGTVVGRWTVIAEGSRRSGLRHLVCRCECGTVKEVFIGNLRKGWSESCGCHQGRWTHGMSTSPEYTLWRAIIQRCHNPKNSAHHNYGARGIYVCERWRQSFEAFYDDVGPRPSPTLTLDRIDNDGPYAPGNVRWATRQQQMANTRLTRAERVRRGRISAMKRWHPESHISLFHNS